MAILETNITIQVKDIEKSIAFYEVIGFNVKHRWENHYAQLTAPGIVIGLHPNSDDKLSTNSGNVSIGFTTDNFDETKSFLINFVSKFQEREEAGGRFLHFNDPDGTALYFISSKW